jgi:hypothetical protein
MVGAVHDYLNQVAELADIYGVDWVYKTALFLSPTWTGNDLLAL